MAQDLGTDAVIAFVCLMSEMQICIDSVQTVFLKFIGFHLFHQSDAASFLVQVNDYSFAFLLDTLHCFVQLLATFAAHGAKDITGCTRRMYTDQDRFVRFEPTFYQGNMFQSVAFLAERDQAEVAILGGQINFDAIFYDRFCFQTI